jgi:hypothetical protein
MKYHGIAVGGTQAGKHMAGDDSVIEVRLPNPLLDGPSMYEFNNPQMWNEPVKDRERYHWHIALRGAFEVNLWLHEDVKTVEDGLRIIFEFYQKHA